MTSRLNHARFLGRCATFALSAGALALASPAAFAQQGAAAAPPASRGAGAPAPVPPPRTDGPPNIILILADDFGVEAVNAYGGGYHTPNLDRLAAEGTRFTNAHAMPLCSPSRVRIMTGLENWRNYEAFGYLAPGQRTFGNMLQDAGYATGMVGKWQLMGNGFDGRVGITPEQAGFDESYLWQLKALDSKGSRYWGPTRAEDGRTRINEEGFGPDYDNAFALDFIERHKAEPFFLYHSLVLTHDPFVPTPDSSAAKGAQDRFAGMVTYMDTMVGNVMDKLRATGLDKNTIVIFTGDNGTSQAITSVRDGHQVRGGKGTPTINGTHVPLIVWAPGTIPEGAVSKALVDFADMLPTFADIAGRPEDTPDGVSQWRVMQGRQESARDSIFMHYAPRWQFEPVRFAFDADYKLYGDGRFVEMDDISGTETEIAARARRGEAAKHYAALRKLLDETPDGELDQERYPWCAGQASVDPALPATVAGCGRYPGA
ncbi:conserved hypothetical protein [Altererythrobacter sp. B11]|uniref:sulfatase-like hydrolase/transferase n=1 Tax=Altererythrobacter sp. B11 TaxID=2060312 RepID=UPI000DC702E5|nr:sulfatase-like hydrolase/transferase [Altererythrobacter sp. B11]BBC74281.1 conserved hypothetical protein [Altererythrobacter sp. B11]